ncbi:MAG: hypothetical protein ACJZ70_09175 [Limisphaerales bacterium]
MGSSYTNSWSRLNKKERKFFTVFFIMTILLSVVYGLSEGNKIKTLAAPRVAGWNSKYCAKCEAIRGADLFAKRRSFGTRKNSGVCIECGTRLTSRFRKLTNTIFWAFISGGLSFLLYINFVKSESFDKKLNYSDAKFTCPYCSQRIEISKSLFGELIKCPTCKKEFRASGIAERDGKTITI